MNITKQLALVDTLWERRIQISASNICTHPIPISDKQYEAIALILEPARLGRGGLDDLIEQCARDHFIAYSLDLGMSVAIFGLGLDKPIEFSDFDDIKEMLTTDGATLNHVLVIDVEGKVQTVVNMTSSRELYERDNPCGTSYFSNWKNGAYAGRKA